MIAGFLLSGRSAQQRDPRWPWHIVACVALLGVLSACSVSRGAPPSAAESEHATVIGVPNARFWVDRGTEAITMEMARSVAAEAETHGFSARGRRPPSHFLALSGGSDDGAFGAGLLVGWTASGQRPEFRLVTGISTGGLIAPFAYLGPAYDPQLRAVFTGVTQKDILRTRFLTAAVFDDALADTSPLYSLISRYVDEQMVADIAREYRKGRLLLIGTTNIDLQRPVLWNLGAIAASGHPGALDLIRRIMLASAAIPGAFPPVLIDVDVKGEHRQEMHVDGGVVAQTFLYPVSVQLQRESRRVGIERERTAYIIRNGRLDPEWTATERRFISIAGRAVSTMIHYSGVNDVMRIYAQTQRDGVAFRLAYIEPDFKAEHTEDFAPVYMNALFNHAYERARTGYPWHTAPPFLESPASSETP